MEPNIWGPGAWLFLHSITLNYPKEPTEQDKKIYSDFFHSLQNILPCSICRENYKIHLNNNPINFNLKNKNDLVRWLIKIHNETNKTNNKPLIKYDEFIEIYKNLYKNENESITYYKKINKMQKYLIYLLVILIICLNIPIILKLIKRIR